MTKIKVFTKKYSIMLFILYIVATCFFFYTSFNHTFDDFIDSLVIATKVFLIPSLIGIFILKCFFEIVLILLNPKESDKS